MALDSVFLMLLIGLFAFKQMQSQPRLHIAIIASGGVPSPSTLLSLIHTLLSRKVEQTISRGKLLHVQWQRSRLSSCLFSIQAKFKKVNLLMHH